MTYQSFASLYDELMKDAPYDDWTDFTIKLLHKYKQDSEKIIDLGCGTGEMSIRLASNGYQIYGVDHSAEMLAYAEQKSFGQSLPIQWFRQDLRQLEGFQEMDVATSFCDVLNYMISEEDVRNVFAHTYHLLKNDGLFIFDVHGLNHVQQALLHETFAEVKEEVSYIWECIPGEHHPGDMHHYLTFFTLLNNNRYERFDEHHHQRVYEPDFYRKLLHDVGFDQVHLFGNGCFDQWETYKDSERIFFLARKESE